MADWKAEAEYWRERHFKVVQRIDDIAWGRNGYDGKKFKHLLALHYAETGARSPSPHELDEMLKMARGRLYDNG